MKKLAVLTFAMISSTAPALAGTSSPQLDPNEVVCRTERVLGSRLGRSRHCATRAQWAEDERVQRAAINSAQTRQTQPSCMNPAERARVNGHYASAALGGAVGCE